MMRSQEKVFMKFKIFLVIRLVFCSILVSANDMNLEVAGAHDIPDILGAMKSYEESPYVDSGKHEKIIEKKKSLNLEAPNLSGTVSDFLGSKKAKKTEESVYRENGYNPPGTFENEENYLEMDKRSFTKNLNRVSSHGLNLMYYKNDYTYTSPNDIITKTINSTPGHLKLGTFYLRSDQYLYKRDWARAYWAFGGGLSFSSGKGIFVDGVASDSPFRLWEFPLDLGMGAEIPIGKILKLSMTGGPSLLGIIQNRSDLMANEPGKNKWQLSYGTFLSCQFKLSLPGLSSEKAYDLFISNAITNMFITLEARYQNYAHFLDPISISGTSFGGGFTFEFL